MDLKSLILRLIREEGPIKVSRFVDLALYHPVYGYYNNTITGKEGDFYTAPDLHPIFGTAIGEYLKRKNIRVVLEAGAGKGWLAHDVLRVFDGEYWIVEKSENMRRIEKRILSDFTGRVKWFPDLESVPEFNGIFLSNELFDAFPFDLYKKTEHGWKEVLVDENLQFTTGDIRDKSVENILRHYEGASFVVIPAGWDEFIRVLSGKHKGEFIVIDYGFEREELVRKFPAGTIQTYKKHQPGRYFLEDPGTQDITFFVDFTLLGEIFKKYGYHDLELKTQADFLIEDLKILEILKNIEAAGDTKASIKARLAVKTLIMDFGRSFKVLRGRK